MRGWAREEGTGSSSEASLWLEEWSVCSKESGCVTLQWPLQPLGLLMGMIIRAALGIKEQCVPGTL